MERKGCLVLEDGHVFEGRMIGADLDSIGELVFTTGVVGYLETLTDPSYEGQIILQTFPLIGNYGVIPEDFESGKVWARGYVTREICDLPSNFRAKGRLDDFLKQQNVAALCGIDTREVTRIIRERGVMNAAIVREMTDDLFGELRSWRLKDALRTVSQGKTTEYPAEGAEICRIALIDYGAKRNIERELNRRGAHVTVFPYNVKAETILEGGFDGLMLSNGPGDPAENQECIAQLKALLGKMPIFGICLGHQMLALAAGARTTKLKYGHRGANQPVKRVSDSSMFITSQNHGYAVVSDSLPEFARESYVNANDQTNEGVEYPSLRAFSTQFHPEACGGPKDTDFLFDQYIAEVTKACR
ncbi:MAG: carbamoyl phosphate synthase small subunit [Clostridia bacterium]|nr:carbamoyl phosphate synthase small subunit [Clostridia bacterium]